MFSPSEKIAFFELFIRRSYPQIRTKARFFRVEKEEIENSLFILIVERLDDFDNTKGSPESFFFGCLHANFARDAFDVCNRATSLSDDSAQGIMFRAEVEYLIATEKNEPCYTHTNRAGAVVGVAELLSLAESASGQSTQEIADTLRLSRRRVNQIRRSKELSAQKQFGLDFSDRKNHD